MARTAIAVQTLADSPTLAAVITRAAVDQSNGNYFLNDGEVLLVIKNGDSGAHTVTLTSVADPFGRTGHITAVSIAAGAERWFGFFKTSIWNQTSGLYLGGVLVDYDAATSMTAAVVRHA